MKVAPLFLTRKTQKTPDSIFGFDESRSVQYKFLNAKKISGMYLVLIFDARVYYFDERTCKLLSFII